MKKRIFFLFSLIIIGLVFFGLSKYNYLLYHIFFETMIAITGILIFSVSTLSKSFNKKSLYVILGPGFLFSSLIGILHMLMYSGMNIVIGYDANIPTQLWIILSYLLAISFLIAILCFDKEINYYFVFGMYFFISILLVTLCFERIFPDCYIDGQGLTLFKKISEYIIIFIYILSLILLGRLKNIEHEFFSRLSKFICTLIVSGFFFTLYSDVFGIFNFLGHYFKFCSFLIIYISLLKDLIVVPYRKILFDSIHDSSTGLYNHKFFFETLNEMTNSNIGIINVDIDALKLINDTLGYYSGDKLIFQTGKIISSSVSEDNSIAAHISGGEFSIIINNASNQKISSVTDKIENELEIYNANTPDLPLSITYGFAFFDTKEIDVWEIYKTACANMYRKKVINSKSTRNTLVKILSKTLEIKDFTTKEHAGRLAELSISLGKKIGLSENKLSGLALFAEFHDIGKIGIPDNILLKPGPLDEEEKLVMIQHSRLGYEIAISSTDLAHISDFILKHHERWDGKGYPFGLTGENIPIECRILCIVDSYDAMTNDRPYRKALSHEEALEELKKCSGTQFDPELVKIFFDII